MERAPQCPPSQPAAPVSSPAVLTPNLKPTLQGPSFVLQVAAVIHEDNANALVISLSKMNFPVFVLNLPTRSFHYVFVGLYNSKDASTKVKNDLEERGFQVMRKEGTGKAAHRRGIRLCFVVSNS